MEEHEYQLVDAADFGYLDLGYYSRTAAALRANGFELLADIEDITLSRVHPQPRTFVRCLVSGDGATGTGICHVKPKGWGTVARLLGVIPAAKGVDLGTELSNGCFICTSNSVAAKNMTLPAQVMTEYLPCDTSVSRLLEIHRQRLEDYLQQNPTVQIVPVHTLQDMISSQNRQTAIKSAYYKSILGGLPEEEMADLAGPEPAEKGQAVLEEMRELEDPEHNERSD